MANQHLVSYVREQLKAGYSPDEIRTFLVGHGYPIRDIDDAVEHARRPIRAPPEIPKKAEEVKPKIEAAHEEESFLDVFKLWFMALFMPGRAFSEEKSRATLGRAFMNILISASLGGLIAGIIILLRLLLTPLALKLEGVSFFGLAPYSTIQQIMIVPLVAVFAWLSITSFFYLFGLLVSGGGTFERFAHFTSLIGAPLVLLLSFLTLLLPRCINFFVFVVFGILGIYPLLYATKEAHETSLGKAALGTFIPILLIIVLLVPVLLKFPSLFGEVCRL